MVYMYVCIILMIKYILFLLLLNIYTNWHFLFVLFLSLPRHFTTYIIHDYFHKECKVIESEIDFEVLSQVFCILNEFEWCIQIKLRTHTP